MRRATATPADQGWTLTIDDRLSALQVACSALAYDHPGARAVFEEEYSKLLRALDALPSGPPDSLLDTCKTLGVDLALDLSDFGFPDCDMRWIVSFRTLISG